MEKFRQKTLKIDNKKVKLTIKRKRGKKRLLSQNKNYRTKLYRGSD